jgi:hypothetical protein
MSSNIEGKVVAITVREAQLVLGSTIVDLKRAFGTCARF